MTIAHRKEKMHNPIDIFKGRVKLSLILYREGIVLAEITSVSLKVNVKTPKANVRYSY